MSEAPSSPVTVSERIASIDVLRGVALLGILLLNILGFALPEAAYFNPSVDDATSGANLVAYAVNWLFFEGAMRAIFSMLFGAGVILLTGRAEARSGIGVGSLYYRRTLWLIAFGLIDAYLLLWIGDILYVYGVAGLLLYFFRHTSPRRLLIAGGVCLGYLVLILGGYRLMVGEWTTQADEARRQIEAGAPISDVQRAALIEIETLREEFAPEAGVVEDEIRLRRSGYLTNVVEFASHVARAQTLLTAKFMIWDALGMMFLGMALFRMGVFDASRSWRFYLTLAGLGYALGIATNAYELNGAIEAGFTWQSTRPEMTPTYEIGRLGCGLGHVAVVMMLCKSARLPWLRRALAAVGQMALTNYLTHSLVGMLLFTGAGFALFGALERYELYAIVAVIWAFQLALSPWWLARFRFGPVEWLWRSLTYLRRQPFVLAR